MEQYAAVFGDFNFKTLQEKKTPNNHFQIDTQLAVSSFFFLLLLFAMLCWLAKAFTVPVA